MVQHLRQKAKQWKSNIQSSHLNILEAFLALVGIILRCLLYHSPVLILTEEKCSYIKIPFISTGLNAIGVSSKLSRKIVYGNKADDTNKLMTGKKQFLNQVVYIL